MRARCQANAHAARLDVKLQTLVLQSESVAEEASEPVEVPF